LLARVKKTFQEKLMDAIKNKPAINLALRSLLEALVDYAGLFPPAGLAMRPAVENYARYRSSPYAWMLGRFIVPVARLTEFEQAWGEAGNPDGWKLSALVAKPENEFPAVRAFNEKHDGKIRIDAVELKAASADEIAKIASILPSGIVGYVEIPVAQDPASLLTVIKDAGLRAKIRTGGLTSVLFPDASLIVRFLQASAEVGVAFKATAGLHHPLRSERPFTYEPNSDRGTMHGFLNVFLAAVFAGSGAETQVLENVLLEESVSALRFSDQGVEWRDAVLSTSEIADMRENFAIAFGSCSFEEPISDLQQLGLLP
jgi:hypothetical protein